VTRTAREIARGRAAGFTLVEMLMVISLLSIVLCTVGVIFHGLRSAQRAIGDHQTAIDGITRLAEQFREDVHSAASAEILAGGADAAAATAEPVEEKGSPRDMLKLSQPNESEIDYQFDGGRVTRVVRSGDQITQRESYGLPERCQVQWLLDDLPNTGSTTKRATAHLSYPLGDQELEFSAQRQLRIDAIVNLRGRETL
jgi:prepilin-type N-terminal cleavage/methylation domain-containing protein